MWIRCFTQQIGCIAVKFQEMFLTTYFTGPHVLFTAECKDLLSGVQLCFLLFPLKGVYLVHKSSSNIYGEVTQRWSWRTRFSSCQLIMMTSPRGRHHEKNCCSFGFCPNQGGGGLKTLFQISVVITCSGNVTKHWMSCSISDSEPSSDITHSLDLQLKSSQTLWELRIVNT